MTKDEFVKDMVSAGYTRDEINRMIVSGKEFDESEKNAFIKKAMLKQGYSSASADKMVNQSRRPIKSGTSNFGSNDDVFGYSFPLVTFIAEDDEDGYEYDYAIETAKDLADEMDIPQYDDYSEPYLCHEPFMIQIKNGYYKGIYIKIREGTDEEDVYKSDEYGSYYDGGRPFTDEEMKKFEDNMNAYLNKLCSDYGWQKLGVAARFNNGETWYNKIENSRKTVKSVSRKVNSAVEQRYGDHGYNSVYNQFGAIFDYDWFAETNNEDKEYLMDEFLQDFHDWLIANGENVDEYAGYNFDVEYEFQKYLEDKPCPEIIEIFELINEWLEKEYDYATSADYLGDLYRYSAGATDIEFYANSDDIKSNAEELFNEQRYTEKDITHGFKSADDLVNAAIECVEQGDVEDVDEYDAGSYGYHKLNTEGDYFETGSCFLGNGEVEYQLPCPVPIDEKYFGYADVEGPQVTYKGDNIYTSPTMMFIYGIPWNKVEEKGRELGLIGGDFKGNESSNEDEDDIPRF